MKNIEVEKTIRNSNAFIPQIGKGSGWMPEPVDPRDYRLGQVASTTTKVEKASLAKWTPPVRDQGTQGSCTGFATASAVGLLRRKESDGPGDYNTIYSPQFIYNNARETIGELDKDYGAYIRDAVGSVRKIGAATEKSFMYYELEDIQFKKPPARAYESARSWKLGAHYACAGLEEVKAAIVAGFPVVFGFYVYTNIGNSYDSGLIPNPNTGDRISGGHAMLIDTFDNATRTVSGPNSWGRKWGDNGRFHLPYDYFLRGDCMDTWALQGESEETKFPRRAI